LTGSGLGCPTWPKCTDESYVAHPALGVHGAIEFGNRLLTFVLIIAAVLTFVSALLYREDGRPRRDLRWLTAGMALGIPLQGVIGGITVLTQLNPYVVALHLVLAEDLPAALLDTEQLKRVFVNLTDNALEALVSIEEARELTITTRHDAARDLLVATVEDSGEGIPRGDFKRLFQPYFSTRGRGTGLGLAIVARIITEHGGRVYAEANTPRGARFVIELPASGQ